MTIWLYFAMAVILWDTHWYEQLEHLKAVDRAGIVIVATFTIAVDAIILGTYLLDKWTDYIINKRSL